MTALTSYSTGLATVGAGGTTVTGTGTIWSGANVKPGDIFQIGNFQSVISDVTDITHLVIPPWAGGAKTGVAYTIWQVSPQRFAGAQAMQSVNELVADLSSNRIPVVVGDDETVPDPSLGEEDQTAIQPTTGKVWVKSGGVWTFLGIYKGFVLTGAWDSGTDYVVGDVVTLGGSSYVCVFDHTNHTPPNTTYWQLLASKGDTGATGATGATGPAGPGDMLAANNLSELTATAATARTNIGAAKSASSRTRTVLTSGSGTWNRPSGCVAINVRMVGGGGGGGGTGSASAGNGGAGGNTTFGSLTANGGGLGPNGLNGGYQGGSGGTSSGGDINASGSSGQTAIGNTNNSAGQQSYGMSGGGSMLGGGGRGGSNGAGGNGGAGLAYGGGGGGAGGNGTIYGAAGGGGGGYCEKLITSPSASYSYAVGAAGTAGAAGTGGGAGGTGAAGVIIVDEYY
ncbi:hypothetical protein LPJ38_26815 [Bradyrhizobium daqingense]|uniref:Carbohydrate binding protein n=1 Tax=Bradyrhizobium daqingense TaxID=993502 RepID=A0A562LMJ3_9BRAD|nr:carbohydrate-binding protein [Bradyrhizobium daqingense]TWI08850.1 carbohydrate binding protein [Bradyrhizobium daqingense]UFS93032.1 hypothetical protein LPJ38_26815 [Bradyrhizobium daqingense]